MMILTLIAAASLAEPQDEHQRQESINHQIEMITDFVLSQSDLNGDGELDRDEFSAFSHKAAKMIGETSGQMPTAEQINEKIDDAFTFDKDESGTLSRAELIEMSRAGRHTKGVAIIRPVPPTNPKSMRMAKWLVERFDDNEDDKLDRSEFRNAAEWIRSDTEQLRNIKIERNADQLAEEWMLKHDANKDRHISIAELAALDFGK